MDERIEDLLSRMTLKEKVSMLAGADWWHTVPVERLGIPVLKVTDGPNGARGSRFRDGPASDCFPVGVALAATWNTELVGRVGAALAEEVQAKGAHMLLAPTVNIHRSPLAGRNFEAYSEDPYLAGRMATEYIRGLQRRGVGACIKHFVCNDSEFERMSISSEVGERALHEIYLTPFRMAVRDAGPWAVMSAYNKLNGTWCSENRRLLVDILKNEWGFDGIVMSDWLGTYSPNAAAGGLDLEMPGPARWMGQPVLDALEAGTLSEAEIDDKVRRLLRTLVRADAFEQPQLRAEQAVDRPEHRRLAREVAGEAIVLLKNSGVLPLDAKALRSIAVIGENAVRPSIMGGGSSHVRPHYVVSPLDGIRRRAGEAVRVAHELGCPIHKMLPLVPPEWLCPSGGTGKGLLAETFGDPEMVGEPVRSEVIDTTDMIWFEPSAPDGKFGVRLSGTFTPPESGRYVFGLSGCGRCRLSIDGQPVISGREPAAPGEERTGEVTLEAGRAHPLVVELALAGEDEWRSLRLGCTRKIAGDPVAAAVALAARSDVAIILAGLTSEWESEGFDRPDMELPGRQAELIEAVAANNPNTIVVLNCGSPVRMGWIDRVAAVVQGWYLGQETGNAIADVLFGDVNPSGKLPTTFPRRLEDTPAFIHYPGERGQVHYGEGIFVGYRYYDAKEVEPLFPFGHGLSYTAFAFRKLHLSATECTIRAPIVASLEVQNTGSRFGKQVVQLYVRDVASSVARPRKELRAFAKVALEPGETQSVTLKLGADALSFYDPERKGWMVEPGEFEVLVGTSSRDIRLATRFALVEEPAP